MPFATVNASNDIAVLPILTFDAARLAPSMGYVFDPKWIDPYESIVGLLWRLGRANALSGQRLVTLVSKKTVDAYDGVEAMVEEVDVRRIARVLGVTQTLVRVGLPTRRDLIGMHSTLRWCTRCIARGYHGVVHQSARAFRCPLHGGMLEERCRGCGESSTFRLDVRLLDSPYRCGHCRRSYASQVWNGSRPRRFDKTQRQAITRAFLFG